jgi:hypothetical protein
LSNFFVKNMEEFRLVDVKCINMNSTWRNKRVGVDKVTKRIDRFLVDEGLMEDNLRMKQWVSSTSRI